MKIEKTQRDLHSSTSSHRYHRDFTTGQRRPSVQCSVPVFRRTDLRGPSLRHRTGAGGLTLTAFQCQRQNGQNYCFVKAEMDGKFVGQVPKPRAEVASQFKACKAGTPFNPPYIAEFPSAYRVVQGMSTGNPRENIPRSIGAFYQLSEIVHVLAGQRALTPDEHKLLNDYSRISSQLVQAGAQKFPNEHFDPASNPYRYSRSDPKFGFEGIPVWTTFLSPGLQAQFSQMAGGNNPQYQTAVEQEKRKAFQQVKADAQAAQFEANMPKDAGTVAMRRCLDATSRCTFRMKPDPFRWHSNRMVRSADQAPSMLLGRS
jgi:hypothetical protein